ncbi:phosphopantetheine-binding protein [Streptomyces sp. TLI_146]|uniref:phosphopantetheine-binding protein n=1 Tax=Streptomyces sp. TLI_146 TaxID=1938858 RepID=UPI000CAE7C0D|nr:phosphopantetheine-binding protein [Streptomyces sp. TLI_146]PKV88646.1 phosphopantetheine binding protein [Streptomyces sp. TLI_146]
MRAPAGELAEVVAWIGRRHPEAAGIGPDDDLIESRLIDSLGFLEFIVLIERLSGRPVDVETLDLDDFRSLSRIERAFFSGPGPRPSGHSSAG